MELDYGQKTLFRTYKYNDTDEWEVFYPKQLASDRQGQSQILTRSAPRSSPKFAGLVRLGSLRASPHTLTRIGRLNASDHGQVE